MPSLKAGTQLAIISLWTSPAKTLKVFGINVKLRQEDWQHIKDFDFGELGYDEEEGLRFYVPTTKLKDVIAYLHQMGLKSQQVSVSLGVQSSGGGYSLVDAVKAEKILLAHGLIPPTVKYAGWGLGSAPAAASTVKVLLDNSRLPYIVSDGVVLRVTVECKNNAFYLQ